jgi:glycosyltransferase involved in cell wall biosynthesis
VIIDDGSIDGTSEIIKTYSDRRIRFFQCDHTGLASSLNFGISRCRGKYIARMDADDISLGNRLAKQLNFLESNPGIDIVASRVEFKSHDDSIGFEIYVEWQNRIMEHEDILSNRFVDSPIIHPSIMARKSAFEKFGYYSTEELPEDYELWLRWLDKGATFGKLHEKLLVWNDTPRRLTRSHPNYYKDRFFQTKAKYFAKWYQQEFSDGKPDIWILGSGRLVFQRSSWLSVYGLDIKGFVNIKSKPSSKRKIIGYNQLPSLENPFFLSYVSDRSGRIKIQGFLNKSGYSVGRHFHMMA